MKRLTISAAILLMAILASCQSEWEQASKGYGYIQLSDVEVNKSVSASRSTGEQLALDIMDDAGNVLKHADNWEDIKAEPVLLPAAKEYTLKAYSYSKDPQAQGFEALPYYAGQVKKTVTANRSETVDIVCTLAQAMVSVAYTDNFKKVFGSDVTCTMTNGTADSPLHLVFTSSETRNAYITSGQALQAELQLPNKSAYTKKIVDNALPAYHYKVTFDAEVSDNGTGDFNVSVDQSKHEYTVVLKVPTSSPDLQTENIAGDASKVWGQFAYLSGVCKQQGTVTFKYKKKSDSQWSTVAAEAVEGQENTYTTKVSPLDLGTEYEYYIACGEQTGETVSFTTESPDPNLTNLNFDSWTQSGKNWYPNAEASNSYWATGNEGVTMFLAGSNDANSVPVEGTEARNGKAAQLKTITVKFAGYAAGSLLIGNYSTNMSNPAASVQFGRAYNGARPVKLSGYYKYQPGATMNSGSVPADTKLETDECDIYIKLWSGDEVIAENHFISSKTVTEYTKFEIPINYNDTTKRPDKITIVATSSRYGGEFKGVSVVGQLAVGSTLWVDDFELSYY